MKKKKGLYFIYRAKTVCDITTKLLCSGKDHERPQSSGFFVLKVVSVRSFYKTYGV